MPVVYLLLTVYEHDKPVTASACHMQKYAHQYVNKDGNMTRAASAFGTQRPACICRLTKCVHKLCTWQDAYASDDAYVP